MILILLRWFRRSLGQTPWLLMAIIAVFHFSSSWAAMSLFEPQGTAFIQADTYWWFYVVTGTTVGYGDFSPATLGGRLSATYVMIGGILLITAAMGKIADTIITHMEKRRSGMAQHNETDHTIVIGDGTHRTAQVLRNLQADTSCGQVILVSDSDENKTQAPLFTKGEITDPQVQEKACLQKAKTIIILTENDAKSTGSVVAILKKTRDDANIVVFFSDESTVQSVFDLDERIRTVSSIDMSALVQEAQDPGAADFARKILDNDADGTYFRMHLPKNMSLTLIEVSQKLFIQGVTLLGTYSSDGMVHLMMNPQETVDSNTVLAVAAINREKLDSLEW